MAARGFLNIHDVENRLDKEAASRAQKKLGGFFSSLHVSSYIAGIKPIETCDRRTFSLLTKVEDVFSCRAFPVKGNETFEAVSFRIKTQDGREIDVIAYDNAYD